MREAASLKGAPCRGTFLGSCCPLRFQKSPVEAPRPGALRLVSGVVLGEGGFVEGRPVPGSLPRLMLSALLQERLWRHPVPGR